MSGAQASAAPSGAQRIALLQLCGLMAAILLLWSLRATVFFAFDESLDSPVSQAAFSNFVKLMLWVLPAAAFAWLRNESPPRYLGLSVFPSADQWLTCIAATSGFLLLVVIVDRLLGGRHPQAALLLTQPFALLFLQFAVSPLLEELLFRGLVMRELLGAMRLPFAAVLTSLLFVASHLPFWLSHGALYGAMLAHAAGVFGFSLLACWLFARTSSVWPPALAHAANNMLVVLLVANRI